MIHVINLHKKYSTGHEALRKLNIHIAKGEMMFLTGHSGAGKSTLLKLLALQEDITRGQIIVAGKHLDKLSKREIPYYRRSLGIIFQDPQLLPLRTVYENVALPLIIEGLGKNEIGRSVRAALDVVGLLGKEKRLPATLSAGEKQRVGIARAIVNRPPLLLADEPTGNLDPDLARDIMNLLVKLNRNGTTIIVATHDLSLIAPFRYRILTLHNGSLVSDGKL